MVTIRQFRELALSLPEVMERAHFDKASFVVNKRIFATLSEFENSACVKLSEIDQYVFSSFDKSGIYPMPNKWGKWGWTFLLLDHVEEELFKDAVITAYCNIAPKRLEERVKNKE